MAFINREHAGRLLAARVAERLGPLQHPEDVLVLALPRGGAPVAAEVAARLGVDWDVLIVRKIGAPGNPEYGIGAVTETGSFWLDDRAVRQLGLTPESLRETVTAERARALSQVQTFRAGNPLPDLWGKTVILVDDGLATGTTAQVACEYLREYGAARIIVAAPVCSRESAERLARVADQRVVLEQPPDFQAVGLWYEDFHQVSDAEVVKLLGIARVRMLRREIRIAAGSGVTLVGNLSVPSNARGLVLFAHGSGSGRFSPRNRAVAEELQRGGFATLLSDLLTEQEALDRERVFDIPLLTARLHQAKLWVLRHEPSLERLPLAYFGASTGAACALRAAAEDPQVAAVISRGGRPDLALSVLPSVNCPVLLIVGGADEAVLELNEQALNALRRARLRVIVGATHLFEEPGALEAVARLSRRWLAEQFGGRERAAKRRGSAA